ncbi:MAG: hypothetical protein IJ223_01790 [Clostridia bacterium]|nr:hypothetical protein [Clostridia bacterium]
MRKEVERILCWQNLYKDYMHYRSLLRKTEQMLSDFRDNCKHEIIVITANSSIDYRLSHECKCLFCGKEEQHYGIIGKSPRFIHSSNKFWLSHPFRFEVAKKLFIKIALDNPDKNILEIAEIMHQEIDSESEDFIKYSEEVYAEFYKK